MGRIETTSQKIENTMDLIWRTLWNRSDDNDLDWNDNDVIKQEISRLINSNSIAYCTGEKLCITSETDYFFVMINGKEQVKHLDEQLKNIFIDFYKDSDSDHSKKLKDVGKIAIVFLVENLETRAFVDKEFKKEKYIAQLKKIVNRKVKIDHIFILNQKECVDVIEINNVDRYSTLQEPRLFNSINFFPEESKKNKKVGYVCSVDLLELIKMYNVVGDHLFDNNVRYGISEQLGVNDAIKKTLAAEGEEFWYRNNGITILVKSNDFQLRYPNKILFKEGDDFSIINGAQTITVASNFYYEALASKETGDKEAKKIIENIKSARVLLRIICINEEKDDDQKKAGNEISVALNRQKPIKTEDIAYTLDYIYELVDMSKKCNLGEYSFFLIKRGEKSTASGSMDLVEFSRARLACIGDPLRARNSSASTLLKNEEKKEELTFTNTNIFAECDTEENFIKNFKGVRFAHDLSKEYAVHKKEVLKKRSKKMTDEDKKYNNLVNNAKWAFISQVIGKLNNGSDDFTNFSYTVAKLDVRKMMENYYNQANTHTPNVDLETFKNSNWFDDMKSKIDMEEVINAGVKTAQFL